MKKVVFGNDADTINIYDVDFKKPIFLKEDDELCGMLVLEPRGWIAKIGPDLGVSGHHKDAKKCMLDARKYGYDFIVNDKHGRQGNKGEKS